MKITTMDESDRELIAKEIEWSRRVGQQIDGIYYHEEQGGMDGMDFTLFPAIGTPEERIQEAMDELRRNRDAMDIRAIYVPADMVANDDRDKPSETAEAKIKKLRDVVENGFNKVDGFAIDSFSASAIVQVYDALSTENKEKFAALSIPRMAIVALKLCK